MLEHVQKGTKVTKVQWRLAASYLLAPPLASLQDLESGGSRVKSGGSSEQEMMSHTVNVVDVFVALMDQWGGGGCFINMPFFFSFELLNGPSNLDFIRVNVWEQIILIVLQVFNHLWSSPLCNSVLNIREHRNSPQFEHSKQPFISLFFGFNLLFHWLLLKMSAVILYNLQILQLSLRKRVTWSCTDSSLLVWQKVKSFNDKMSNDLSNFFYVWLNLSNLRGLKENMSF